MNESSIEPYFLNCMEDLGLYGGTKRAPTQSLTSAANRFNGQYMIGYVAVGIYLMESVGSVEDWWPAAEQQTFNEIVEGLDRLADSAFNRGTKLVWVFPPVEKISTSFEPILGEKLPKWEFLNWVFDWLDDIYTSQGYPDEWDGAYALANGLRKTYKTNWAVEIAVVMDANDPDHAFWGGKFAWVKDYQTVDVPWGLSEHRSPLVVMTYNNNSWGPSRMDRVIAHEISHTFGASDEYYNPPDFIPSTCEESSSCGYQRAFLSFFPAVNGNYEFCNGSSEFCYMKGEDTDLICVFTPAELGWRDSDGDGPMDPIDQNTGMFMWIHPVAAGDLITIATVGLQFVNLISVSPDMLVGANNDWIFWDGSMYNDLFAGYGLYPVSKNGSDLATFLLNFSSGFVGMISDHSYQIDILTYTNSYGALYIRHTIYDSLGNLYSRPRFDVMTNHLTTINTNILGYEDGIYTSEVFGWQPSGTQSNVSTLIFINYLCGDANNDGIFNLLDLTFLVDLIFRGGPYPLHPASLDLNCDGVSSSALDLTIMVDFFYRGGPAPTCCHTLP